MIQTKTTLTPLEQTILNIITNEPNITDNLIRTTANHQGTNITKTQLKNTLQTLTQKQLIKQKEQQLAANTYKTYTRT
ncbi:MAG: hypothetical protein NWF07_14815 [Candidatus Bathyarchaeota archaeon]|nr:hypothetical protein [Candidatus Bathyarchaeota archaeon]